jgi:Ca2+/Na+ antiporter
MRISEKIDFKKYILLSLPLLVISYALARNSAELIVMATVFVAACLNQWMLVSGVHTLVTGAASEEKSDNGGVILFFIGKIFVLVVALTLGVQTMGKRIIIPLLIYVLQIVVLYFSFKKKGSN